MYKVDFKNTDNINEYLELIKVFLSPEDFEISDQNPSKVFDLSEFKAFESDTIKKEDSDKNRLKRYLYKELSEVTGIIPSWGILTGIRPEKLFRELVLRENSTEKAGDIMSKKYLVQPDRIKLLNEIYEIQKPFCKDSSQKNKVGIYIGIPFCPTRCLYCSFTSNQVDYSKVLPYIGALKKEIEYVGKRMKENSLIAESIYIGGGTPTTLKPDEMKALLNAIKAFIPTDKGFEYTCEAGRPDTFSSEILEILRLFGINRISINPQTMKDDTLKLIDRSHTSKDTFKAYETARDFGFDVINMDLIMGLPGENISDFENSLIIVSDLKPENITVHSLAVKRSSKLKETDPKFNYKVSELTCGMLDLSRKILTEKGYSPYYLYRQKQISGNLENTGYCLSGFESCYNIKIMEENQTVLALGAGGISKIYYSEENRLERIANVSNYEIYIERINDMINRKEKGFFKLI